MDGHSEPRQTALITGASGGIGYELAQLFAQNGYQVVLVARSADKLSRIADAFTRAHGVPVVTLPLDLSDPVSPTAIYDTLHQRGIIVDVLVNNAGAGTYGKFAQTDLAKELRIMQLNMVTPAHLTRLFLPEMLQRHAGKILIVSSTAAFQPGPLMANYYASKAYLLSLGEAIANEIAGSGVTLTVLCPGATRTEFQARAGIEGVTALTRRSMDPATVARAGYRGLMAGKTLVIPGLRNQFLALASKFGPRGLVVRIVRRLQEEQP